MQLSRQTRIILLLILDISFFLMEIVTGYWIKSLALIADSFHMLNDILSLIVALYALKLATKTTHPSQYSYGWQRAEVLGALVNGVFLMALCFSILIEAIERIFESQEIQRPEIIFGVGCAGLVSNIFGLLLFHEHGHGHGHSHGKRLSKGDTEPIDEILVHPAAARQSIVLTAQETEIVLNNVENRENEGSSQYGAGSRPETPDRDDPHDQHRDQLHDHKSQYKSQSHDHGHKNLNMQGVFIHVLGDALGNVGVIATGLFIYYTHFSWRFYADPVISMILTIIIFSSALPLVRSASYILLQRVPSEIPIDDVRLKIRELPDILDVHELHIWQLSDTKRICSIHVLLTHSTDYMKVAASIREILHAYGVHSLTIQPEFVKVGMNSNDSGEVIMVTENSNKKVELVANEIENHESACLLRCNLDDSCAQNLCCPPPPPLRITETTEQ